jgi:hypothetical protein
LEDIKDASDRQRFTNVTDALPEFRCQGVALGQAFASPLTGDTVATVLVGCMMTVMNGHFEMFAGTSPPTDACARFEKSSFYDDSSSSDRTLQGHRKPAAEEYHVC